MQVWLPPLLGGHAWANITPWHVPLWCFMTYAGGIEPYKCVIPSVGLGPKEYDM